MLTFFQGKKNIFPLEKPTWKISSSKCILYVVHVYCFKHVFSKRQEDQKVKIKVYGITETKHFN